ncbi:hypothetical protein E3E31_12035 [Thermococcus sp. M39]|uniref:hypothetical protein n=1 Tax=Thermococcus sp. M39 TaxID=1638262 RepID=UPI00143B7321|nr:hypothetical protein [Thermococcus sp. M39]NJE09237.1 hypothetical protein [Thermococcus sp. M39]
MRKAISMLIGILILMSFVGVKTVKADTTTFLEIDGMTASDLQNLLASTNWTAYAPVITNITDVNGAVRVYFASEKDLARFLMPVDAKNTFLVNPANIKAPFKIRVVTYFYDSPTYGTRTVLELENFTSIVDTYAIIYQTGGTGSFTLYANGNQVLQVSGEAAAMSDVFYPSTLSAEIYDPSDGVLPDAYFTLVFLGDVQYAVAYEETGQISVQTDVTLQTVDYVVYVSLKDALTGQALQDVTVKEGDTVIATVSDGGAIELGVGEHTLTFEKDGYWSTSITIDVQSDMNISVEMYPSSAAVKFENFPEITAYDNSIVELTFTVSPISTDATKNAYLSLVGLDNVLEVRKDGSVISPEGGKYYLGDIDAPISITIKFKAEGVGQHTFSITVTSQDLLGTNTYTTTKQVVYEVQPLPFAITLPSEWQVGGNEVRISETQGNQLSVLLVLKDEQGNEVWSESYIFEPYEAHTFSVQVPSEGSYVLEVQFNGYTALFDVTVNPAITLVTKTIEVTEGGEGTITLHFNNPSSDVKYYTIILSGGFLPAEINQTVSIAPLTEKDVSIAFAVPNDLTYDAYEINVAVYEGDALVFSDKVAVTVTEDSGFSLPIGGGGDNSWLIYGIAGLIVIAILAALARR